MNIRKTESPLKIASIHESGHALVYHLLGETIDFIEILKDGGGFVKCNTYKPTYGTLESGALSKRMERYGMICLSGYCAELKHSNKRLKGILAINDGSLDNDIDTFRKEMLNGNKILDKIHFDDLFFYLTQTSTRKLIGRKKNWNAILELSQELMEAENNFMPGVRVHEILNSYVQHGSYM